MKWILTRNIDSGGCWWVGWPCCEQLGAQGNLWAGSSWENLKISTTDAQAWLFSLGFPFVAASPLVPSLLPTTGGFWGSPAFSGRAAWAPHPPRIWGYGHGGMLPSGWTRVASSPWLDSNMWILCSVQELGWFSWGGRS